MERGEHRQTERLGTTASPQSVDLAMCLRLTDEHEVGDASQVGGSHLQEVNQTSRSANQNFDSVAEIARLLRLGHTAELRGEGEKRSHTHWE